MTTQHEPVSQRAREAAADQYRDMGGDGVHARASILRGEWDDLPRVQAFARFERTISADHAVLRKALQRFLVKPEDWFDNHADDVGMSHFRRVTFGDYRFAQKALATTTEATRESGLDLHTLEEALKNAKWLLEGIKRAGWVTNPSFGDDINLGLERIDRALKGGA